MVNVWALTNMTFRGHVKVFLKHWHVSVQICTVVKYVYIVKVKVLFVTVTEFTYIL